jgi:hypothetical protein
LAHSTHSTGSDELDQIATDFASAIMSVINQVIAGSGTDFDLKYSLECGLKEFAKAIIRKVQPQDDGK